MTNITKKLEGGDRRSIGKSDQVVIEILENPALFEDVFEAIQSHDPVLRMRASDVVEKVTQKHPEYLEKHKDELIHEIATIDQKEVRWHVAQMLPRLVLTDSEVKNVVDILMGFLDDKSKIVQTFSMQALADLAMAHPNLCTRVIAVIENQMITGSPAVVSRGEKLLDKLRRTLT